MAEDYLSATNTSERNKEVLNRTILAAAGSTVEIAKGTYLVDPLIITTPGTHLKFAPGAILQVSPDSAAKPSLLEIRASDVTIEGGHFDGSSVSGISGIMAIRIIGSHSRIAIRNCTFRNTTAAVGAYHAKNCSDWLIENCLIDGTVKGHALYLHGHPTDNLGIYNVRILNNIIRNAAANGIWMGNRFSDVMIKDNYISFCKRMALEVWNNPEGNFVISSNHIKDCGLGISIARTPNTICSGNLIARCMTYGIEVAASRQVSLVDNHIEDITSRVAEIAAKSQGIAINARVTGTSGDISIQGGSIKKCMCGINVCGDAAMRDHISIVGVTIKECDTGIRNAGHVGQNDGGGPVEHLVINGCNIDCVSVGIGNSPHGGGIRSGVITGNNVCVSNGFGIDLYRPDNTLIANNRVCGAGPVGIRVRNALSFASLISSNLITGFIVPTQGVPL